MKKRLAIRLPDDVIRYLEDNPDIKASGLAEVAVINYLKLKPLSHRRQGNRVLVTISDDLRFILDKHCHGKNTSDFRVIRAALSKEVNRRKKWKNGKC